jgi:zinc transporter ZupT
MAPLTIVFGVLFIAVGIIGYLPTSAPTALIPAGFGAAFILLGILARQERLRMHVMHGAALLGLIALAGAVVMIFRALASEHIERPVAFTMQIIMAILAAAFLFLCVRSFVEARRRRRQQAGTP